MLPGWLGKGRGREEGKSHRASVGLKKADDTRFQGSDATLERGRESDTMEESVTITTVRSMFASYEEKRKKMFQEENKGKKRKDLEVFNLPLFVSVKEISRKKLKIYNIFLQFYFLLK